MSRFFALLLLIVLGCSTFVACGNDDDDDDTANDDDIVNDNDVVSECDDSLRPMVFAHGFLASGDTYANVSMRFAANGYCLQNIHALDWNTMDFADQDDDALAVQQLDALIDEVLAETGADQVDLGGHSAGGGLGLNYLSDPERAAKVAHYAHLASFEAEAAPEGVPTLNLSSAADMAVGESTIPGATNVHLEGHDHMQVPTTPEAFVEIYRHFTDGEEPEITAIVPQTPIDIAGRAVTLGENKIEDGATVRIYEVDPATGMRLDEDAEAEFTTDERGYWGPWRAEPETYYELMVVPDRADPLPIHYYREPFVRSNDLVYLRTLPEPVGLMAALTALLQTDSENATLVTFTTNQATVFGRDTLEVAGYDLATEEMTSADQTTIAIFFQDANQNGETDAEGAGGLFATLPFLQGFDLLLHPDDVESVPIVHNGRTINVPVWSTNTDGVTIAVFE